MSRRPLIGVTGPDAGGDAAWWLTRLALWRAGARACRIRPSQPATAETLDGLVIGGGADVDPTLYGREAPSIVEVFTAELGRRSDRSAPQGLWRRLASLPTLLIRRLAARSMRTPKGDRARDALETRLLTEALTQEKPVLGICRGAQLLNVHLGGTLHQELRSFYEETPQIMTVLPEKRVDVEAGTLLERILQIGSCKVNALHRQAVDQVAEPLQVAACETTGVIQAIEHRERPFVLGVQWHPEYLPQVPRQQRIFKTLVAAARRAA